MAVTERSKGMAIAMILLAVVLLAAVAFAIANSSKTGADTGSDQDRMAATAVMDIAQQFKNSFEIAISNGADPATVTAAAAPPMTTFSPASANILSILAPANATTGTQNWYWNGANHPIKFANIGTVAGNYVLALIDIRQSVCQQINQALFGNTNIPTIATNGWDDNPGDLTNDPATAGVQEGCFYYAPDPEYFYYKIIMIQ